MYCSTPSGGCIRYGSKNSHGGGNNGDDNNEQKEKKDDCGGNGWCVGCSPVAFNCPGKPGANQDPSPPLIRAKIPCPGCTPDIHCPFGKKNAPSQRQG